VRKLLWEIAGAAGAYNYRLYATRATFELTVNARWDGTQWLKDSTTSLSAKLEMNSIEFRLNSDDGFTSPFPDQWPSSIGIEIPRHGKQSFDAGGNWTSPGLTETYIAWQGESPRELVVGSGAPFRKVFPATPSSITFSLLGSLNMSSGPFPFFPTAAGTGAVILALNPNENTHFNVRVFAL
jgi:hypothetical protein